MCRIPVHVYRVEISAVGLVGKVLRVVSEAQSWGDHCNEPLRLEGDRFVGQVRLDPGDLALIKVEGLGEEEKEGVKAARRQAGAHQEGDDYGTGVPFLLVPGWEKSSEGMPYLYSIVPRKREEAA